MRIALVSPYSLGVYGGVQNQVRGLAEYFARSEQVSVIAPGPPVTLRGLVTSSVGSVTSVPVNGSRAPIALSPRSWVARNLLRDIDPDVIHVHEPFVPVAGISALKNHRAPLVATFHRGGSGHFYPLLAPLLRRDFERIALRVAVSEAARATLQEVFGESAEATRILPNAVDLDRFIRTPVGEVEREPVVAFVGRIEPRKGLSVLLEAFGDGLGAAKLEVIGDGPDLGRLRQRFSRPGVIEFLGAIDDEALAAHLAAAEVFVAPSISGESFGVVLLEAMAARTAVIASSIPGYHLAAGDAAVFVPPGDVAALRTTLIELLASPSRRADLVSKGVRRAAGHSFEALAGEYLRAYVSLLSG